MLNTKLPKFHYKKGTLDAAHFVYPNLDDNFDGMPVRIAIGDIHNIVPVCIDTAAQVYQICGHAIHDVTEVRDAKEGTVLTISTDYTLNAGKNEITFLGTPLLAATTVYYLALEADYAVSGTNHEHYAKVDQGGGTGGFYTINAGGVWNADTAHHLKAIIYGKESLGGTERAYIWTGTGTAGWAGVGLRDHADRTRLGQKFTTGSKAFYITRVRLYPSKSGTPTGNIYASILSDITTGAEVQVGCDSQLMPIPSTYKVSKIAWPQRATDSGLIVDIEGAEEVGGSNPITTVSETLKYLTQTVLGKPAALLDATYLADLATDRTQTVKLNLDYETEVGAVIGTLETGQLWKLVPLLDGTYGTVVYEAGEPANTPHFRDEDYLSFRMWQDYGAVRSKVVIKYDRGADNTQEYKTEQASSDIARFFYLNEETLEVETFLRASAGATWLAGALGAMYEQPPIMVEFEVHGWGLDLIPGRDKVKLTRTRAMYAGGTLSAVLFRILRLQKKPGTSTTVITAILDTQSY